LTNFRCWCSFLSILLQSLDLLKIKVSIWICGKFVNLKKNEIYNLVLLLKYRRFAQFWIQRPIPSHFWIQLLYISLRTTMYTQVVDFTPPDEFFLRIPILHSYHIHSKPTGW
jgi:hypothetical protein